MTLRWILFKLRIFRKFGMINRAVGLVFRKICLYLPYIPYNSLHTSVWSTINDNKRSIRLGNLLNILAPVLIFCLKEKSEKLDIVKKVHQKRIQTSKWLSYFGMLSHATPLHVINCHCKVMLYHVPRHTCHIMSCHVIPSQL